ncbi:hypothetical protein [Sutcliffiella horikoshii]|uniref:hypothetical protein n=1 Tax=Sutcliffiella horikoshii TaxID=79883 RepID=UPI001653B368|nr:hypothetical protein [Sutcliffiella horikoshii]
MPDWVSASFFGGGGWGCTIKTLWMNLAGFGMNSYHFGTNHFGINSHCFGTNFV